MRRMRVLERQQHILLGMWGTITPISAWYGETIRKLRQCEKDKGWTPTQGKTDLETYQEQKWQIQEKAERRRKAKERKR